MTRMNLAAWAKYNMHLRVHKRMKGLDTGRRQWLLRPSFAESRKVNCPQEEAAENFIMLYFDTPFLID